MPGVAAVFTADDLRDPPAAAERQRRGCERHAGGPVRSRGARARRGPLRRRAGRGGDRGFARARAGRGGGGLAGGRPARRRDRRGGGGGGRRSAALPRPRLERRARVRAALGCGRAGGRRRRRAARGSCNNALAPVPMETNAIAVVPEDGGGYTVWVRRRCRSTSGATWPSCSRSTRSRSGSWRPTWAAGSARSSSSIPEYAVVAAAAKALGRPVRWAESRSESMLNLTHGRAQVQHVEIGAKRDGTVVGMRVELLADMGAYPVGAFLPTTTQEMLAGVYTIPAIASRGRERGHERHAGRGLPRRGPAGGDGAGRARDGPDRRGARDGSGRGPPEEPDPRRRLPVHDRLRHDVRHRRLRARARRGAADRRRTEAPGGAGGATGARRPPAARHRRQHLRGDHRVRVEGVRLGGGGRRRHRHRAHRHVAARTGARDGDRADRLGGPGRAVRDGARRPFGQRRRASRRGHVGLAVAAGRRLGGRRADAGGRREGPHARRRTCSRWTRPISRNRGRAVRGRGRARARDHVGGARGGRGRPVSAAGGHDPRPRRVGDVPRAGVDVPVRCARGRRRGRLADRRRAAGASRRGRRLRPDPQPDARRRAGRTAGWRRASRRRCTRRSATTRPATR